MAYVAVPPEPTPGKINAAFARFAGLGEARGLQRTAARAEAACEKLIASQTDIDLVDDIHNLGRDFTASLNLPGHLGYFASRVPATFIYAGTGTGSFAQFTTARSGQARRRYAHATLTSHPFEQEWRDLVGNLDNALRLHRHQPGSLLRQARSLHLRAGGLPAT